MSVSAQATPDARDDSMGKAAHEWSLGITVAEEVQAGVPMLAAVEKVASRSGEGFVAVFAATCRLVADSTS